jgi:hypothetical protein
MPLMDFVRNITTSLRRNTIQKYSHLEGVLYVAFLSVVDPQHQSKSSGFYRAAQSCLETLKDTVPVGQFSVWIKPLKAQEENGTLTILAPTLIHHTQCKDGKESF